MATKAKFGTQKALKDAMASSKTAVAGGASAMVKVGGKLITKKAFSKLMTKHSMAPDPRELSAGKGLVKRYLPKGSKMAKGK